MKRLALFFVGMLGACGVNGAGAAARETATSASTPGVYRHVHTLNQQQECDFSDPSGDNADTIIQYPLYLYIGIDTGDGTIIDSLWEKDSSCALHPGGFYIPSGLYGYRYHEVVTPIPNFGEVDSAQYEEMQYFVSNDGESYESFKIGGDSVENPVWGIEDFEADSSGTNVNPSHLSDFDLFVGHDGVVWSIGRVDWGGGTSRYHDLFVSLLDTTGGSAAFINTDANGDTLYVVIGSRRDEDLMSPTIVADTDGSYDMWTLQTESMSPVGRAETTRVIHWESAYPCSGWTATDTTIWPFVRLGTDTLGLWHAKFLKYGSSCIVCVGAYIDATNFGEPKASGIYINAGTDGGATWSAPALLLTATESGWDSNYLYRANAWWLEEENQNVLELTYSARGEPENHWGTGRTKIYFQKVDSCCTGTGGNVDGDPGDQVNVADMTYLVDYLFRGGPPPPCPEEGDVNGDGNVNIADLTYLVDYLFHGGPPPPPCP